MARHLTLVRATDQAIAEENRRFEGDPEAQRQARELGDLYRRVIEAQRLGFVQRPYPQETLAEFSVRAGITDRKDG